MFTRSNFLTAMSYILLSAVFIEWNQLTPALVANSMLIWLYIKLVRLFNDHSPKTLLFNIGLIIGTCVLLYHPTALMILLATFALMVVRPFEITEWLVLLMGICSPFYFLGVYLFLTDQFSHLTQYLPAWQLNIPHVHSRLLFLITIGTILIILFVGVYHWQNKNRRMLIHIRKNWGVLIVMLFVMLPVPFISKNAGVESLMLWIIPVCPFMAQGFLEPKKNRLPNVMFGVLVVLIVLNNWFQTRVL
jgi:hypothetical protein